MGCNNDCTALPSSIEADADIAGIGILISFTLVTVLTIVIALFWWYMDLIETAAERKFSLDLFNGSIRTSLQTQSLGWLREDRRKRWAKIAQQLILALSDQQLVTGIALLATAQLRFCQLTSYHYRTTVLLAFVSIAVHSLTIRALAAYMEKYPIVAIAKFIAIAVHIILLFVGYARTISGGVGSVNGVKRADVRWPISCSASINHQFFNIPSAELGVGNSDRKLLTAFLVVFIVMIIGSVSYLVATWRDPAKNAPSNSAAEDAMKKVVAMWTSFFLNLAVAIAGLIFSIASVFKMRVQVRPYLQGNEDEWGFGQIMAILLLIILLFMALESIADTKKDSLGNGESETQSSSAE